MGRIEAKMQELAAKKVAIEPRVVSKEDAQALFESKGQPYKLEILDALSDQVDITVFRMGDFEDLCKGPHVANTGSLRHFKLTRVSGAYWKGDKRRETLQRIQGVGFESKEELKAYLRFQEEAAARDHRKLGRELGLFHLDEHSPGTVFWHPKGWAVWQRIEQYMRGVDNCCAETQTNLDIREKLRWRGLPSPYTGKLRRPQAPYA